MSELVSARETRVSIRYSRSARVLRGDVGVLRAAVNLESDEAAELIVSERRRSVSVITHRSILPRRSQRAGMVVEKPALKRRPSAVAA